MSNSTLLNGCPYNYDAITRLPVSSYAQYAVHIADASWWVGNKFTEKDISYDFNGNIRKLKSYDANVLLADDLT